MAFVTDNISIQGYSHIVTGKECQDASASWSERKYSGVIVCDGHGGEKYIRSARGAQNACIIGKAVIDEFMNSIKEWKTFKPEVQFPVVERYIINKWRLFAENDLKEHPLEDDDCFKSLSEDDKNTLLKNPIKAYGSTFIAAVLTKRFYFVLKLGDGNINVITENGNIETPQELENDEFQFNVTTSLCQTNADVEFRHFFKKHDTEVQGIVLTSDGVVNCFQKMESYHALISNIFSAYADAKSTDMIESAREELRGALDEFSKRGSGDDLSVSIAVYTRANSENTKL